MMESEDWDSFDVVDPRSDFENSVISEMQIASFAESTITAKDREILKLRMEGYTETKIVGKVGYKMASAVHKRISKIADAYELLKTAFSLPKVHHTPHSFMSRKKQATQEKKTGTSSRPKG